MSLNDTPRADRLHIGIFGKRNSGKSSLINALTGQDIALVSDMPGTTTDPVLKSMELHPVGPVVFIDTAGFDDEGQLGKLRVQRTAETLVKTDIGIVVIDGEELAAAIFGKEKKSARLGYCQEGESEHDRKVAFAAERAECKAQGLANGETNMTTKTKILYDLYNCLEFEKRWLETLEAKDIPVIIVVNKCEKLAGVFPEKNPETSEEPTGKNAEYTAILSKKNIENFASENSLMENETLAAISRELGDHPVVFVSAAKKTGLDLLRKAIEQAVPEDFLREKILGDLIKEGDIALLVMPQDIQAPKGRLILPQVQSLRELLDRKCTAVSTTVDGLERALSSLNRAPDLIITDSQCFDLVYQKKPKESDLTSFSVLFAAYKGDIKAFTKGASALGDMTENSKVLIAEACTHVPLSEDIGREKIPNLLRKKFGSEIEIVNVCGGDFPKEEELKSFDLVIHCGACMFNRKHVMNRISAAENAGVPITNYGVVLAKLAGILDKIKVPK